MTFSPVLPSSGLVGWSFLQRTQDVQKSILEQTPQFQREAQHFRKNIGTVQTVDDLMEDPVLLRLSLTAFGLEDDLANKYFIRKVLSDGTSDDTALANRLADQRYADFSSTFGFGAGEILRTSFIGFADEILERSLDNTFQTAVGEQDPNLRLALGLEDALGDIAQQDISDTAKWFTILGTPPVRAVFEGALGLSSSIGTLDIDRQLEVFRERARSVFGTDVVSELATEDAMSDLTRKFLLLSETSLQSSSSSAANALALLQNAALL